jgi:hypothetical protein
MNNNIKEIREIKEMQKPLNNNIDNLIAVGHQSLSILLVMGVGIIYKYVIAPQIDKFKNSLSRTMEQEKQILVLMSQIKEFYGADRVLLDAVHNGTSIVTGTHMYKISTYLEVTNNSFKSIKEHWQSIPVNNLIPYFELLLKKQSKSFYADNISHCKLTNTKTRITPFSLNRDKVISKEEIEIPSILQDYYSLTDVNSIIHILILKGTEVTGILCIHNPIRNTSQVSKYVEDIEAIYNKKNNIISSFIK